MRTIITTLIALGCWVSHATAQEWVLRSPTPQTNTLNEVQMVTNQIGFAAGDKGTIIKTTNGGIDWEVQSTPTSNELHALWFTDTQNGRAVGASGTILLTTNGGEDWIDKGRGIDAVFYDVYFTDVNHGAIVGSGFVFLLTSDGGVTWTEVDAGLPYSGYFEDVWMFDSETILVFTSSISDGVEILRSSNGGTDWSTTFSQSDRFSVHDAVFIDSETGYALLQYEYLKTTDGGVTWIVYQNESYPCNTLMFFDRENGLAVGSFSSVRSTSNGGASWKIKNPDIEYNKIRDGCVSGQNSIVLVGEDGLIYTSSDRGATAECRLRGTDKYLRGVWFADANIGYAVGEDGTIVKTSDQGASWVEKNSGTSQTLYDVEFTSQTHGVAVGWSEVLLTTNGGNTWLKKTVEHGAYHSVGFADENHGMVVGRDNSYRTSDGGNTWTKMNIGSSNWLNDVAIHSAVCAFAVGDDNTVLYTPDFGDTWESRSPDVSSPEWTNYHSVCMTDPVTAYIVTGSGYNDVYKTSDCGLSWVKIETNMPGGTWAGINSVRFINPSVGYIVGEKGGIARTDDAGETWTNEMSGFSKTLYDVCISPTGGAGQFNATVVGNGGLIVQKRIDGVTSVKGSVTKTGSIVLEQNYPQPASGATHITYTLPSAGYVNLRVYDMHGRLVQQLEYGRRMAGVHSAVFQTNGLPAGLYLYALEVAGTRIAKLMTIVR